MFGKRKGLLVVVPLVLCVFTPGCPPGAGFLAPSIPLNVTPVGEGSVQLDPEGGLYALETEVTLTATPAPAWRFGRWEGDHSGTENPTTVIMDAEKNITAVFIRQFVLVVKIEGQGAVETDPAQGPYDQGSVVTLVAKPTGGWVFSGWEGNATGTSTTTSVTMDSDKTVTAVFLSFAGQRSIILGGFDGRMTLAVNGPQIKGTARSFSIAFDVEGTKSDKTVTLTLSTPGFSDAVVTATVQSDGSLEGTISGSGFFLDPFSADPVAFTGFEHAASGYRTIWVDGDPGRMTLAANGADIRGNARYLDLGLDVRGTLSGNDVAVTLSAPGFQDSTVTATIQGDGSWTGTIDGSGFNNDPFEADPSTFP